MVFNPDTFNKEPYYDDFDAEKRFLRMLFRPGYAVQARELTQLQTILQAQIQHFGNHVFDDGSLISGGQITEYPVQYVRVSPTILVSTNGGASFSTVSPENIQSSLGVVVGNEIARSTDTTIRAKIQHTLMRDSDSDPYHVLFITYMSGAGIFEGTNTLDVTDRNNGNIYRFTVKADSSDSIPNRGSGILVSTQPGVYYTSGFFVLTEAQRVVPFNVATSTNRTDENMQVAIGTRMFSSPTSSVGFIFSGEIITSIDDESLGDPAFGSTNYAAPGADRYRGTLTLESNPFVLVSGTPITISDISSENFYEILRIERGVVTRKEKYASYADLEDYIARRTHDQAGNYTIDPFEITIREHLNTGTNGGLYTSENGGDDSKLVVGIEPGRAYVRGYEFENPSTVYVEIDKARTTDSVRSALVQYNLGSYFIVGATDGIAYGFTSGVSVLDSEDHPEVYLYDSAGLTVGDCRFRQLQLHSATGNKYRFFISELGLSSGASVINTEVIKALSGATIAIIDPVSGKTATGETILFNATPDNLLVDLPVNASIADVTLVDHEAQISLTGTVSGDTLVFSVPALSGDPIIFKNPTPASFNRDLFLINTTTNEFIGDYSGVDVTPNGSNTEITIDFGHTNYDGDTFTLIANVDVEPGDTAEFVYRTKTLNATQSETITLEYDGVLGQTYGSLGYADVYVVESIVGADTAEDYSDAFVLDDGQRDTLYDHAKIILRPGYEVSNTDADVVVSFRRFTHTGQYGPFIGKSYPIGVAMDGATFGYANVPSFTSEKTGKTVSLRDVLDFRPIKNPSGDIENAFLPTNENMLVDFSYYQPRIDKIALQNTRRFLVLPGIPSITPVIPEDDPNSMTLFILNVGSYTFNKDDISVQYVDNKRFTMNDIGKIETRVNQLEFYSSLSLLEQEANSLTFTDSNGSVIPKTGIVVDNFNGHEIGDVTNRDYICSMDYERGTLRPAFKSDHVKMVEKSKSSTIKSHTPKAEIENSVVTNDNKIYTLDYEEVRAVQNILPTTTINPNPTGRIEWYGNLYASPESDVWYSQTKRPDVKLNKEGANDAWQFRPGNFANNPNGFGSQWNDWELNWFGVQSSVQLSGNAEQLKDTKKVYDETFSPLSEALRDDDHKTTLVQRIAGLSVDASTSQRGRESLQQRNIPDTIIYTIQNRMVNTTIKPYARNKTIYFHADCMKPNTELYVFLDNQSQGTVLSDSTGKVNGSFALNSSVLSGIKLLRVTDSASNSLSAATTLAETNIRISGVHRTNRNDFTSTKGDVARRSSINSTEIASGILSRNRELGYTATGFDNLAQNFIVDRGKYNNGLFVSSIDLLISRVPGSGANDTDTSLPISVEIRPTVNGYPHPSRIIPGSIKSLSPSEINASGSSTDMNNPNIRTRFTLDYPVYLSPGEYSIVIRTNSDRYLVYVSDYGNQVSLEEGSEGATGNETVTRQPYVGAFFRPQNAGGLIMDTTKSLTFAINRCEFETTGEVVFRNKSGAISADTKYDYYMVHSTHLDPQCSCSLGIPTINYEIATTPEAGSEPGDYRRINPNETIRPNTSSSSGKTQIVSRINETIRLKVTMRTSDRAISPLVDAERLGVVVIQNFVNESSSENSNPSNPNYNGELDPLIPQDNAVASLSRYITRPVLLGESLDSTDLRVFLRINRPYGTDIQVFARVLGNADTQTFEEKPYIELVAKTEEDGTMPKGYSLTRLTQNNIESDFVDVEYKAPDPSVFGTFKVFSVKIVMHTNDQFTVPKCKDLRIVALA